MEDKNKREYTRVTYNMPLVIEPADIAIPVSEGRLCDISLTGCMAEINEKPVIGLMIRISVKKFPALVGHIRWLSQLNRGYRVGIMFDESASEKNRQIIDMITSEILNETRARQQQQ